MATFTPTLDGIISLNIDDLTTNTIQSTTINNTGLLTTGSLSTPNFSTTKLNVNTTPLTNAYMTSLGVIPNQTFSIENNGLVNSFIGNVELQNTQYGSFSLNNTFTGINNSSYGAYSLNHLTNGNNNSSYGSGSMYSNTSGSYCTSIGQQSLYYNTIGTKNTAIGYNSLFNNVNTSNNTALGYNSGINLTNSTSNNNTFLGANTDLIDNTNNYSNSTAIGYNVKIKNSNEVRVGTSSEKVVIDGSLYLNNNGTSSLYFGSSPVSCTTRIYGDATNNYYDYNGSLFFRGITSNIDSTFVNRLTLGNNGDITNTGKITSTGDITTSGVVKTNSINSISGAIGSSSNISTTGSITTTSLITDSIVPSSGNLSLTGNFSSTGNINSIGKIICTDSLSVGPVQIVSAGNDILNQGASSNLICTISNPVNNSNLINISVPLAINVVYQSGFGPITLTGTIPQVNITIYKNGVAFGSVISYSIGYTGNFTNSNTSSGNRTQYITNIAVSITPSLSSSIDVYTVYMIEQSGQFNSNPFGATAGLPYYNCYAIFNTTTPITSGTSNVTVNTANSLSYVAFNSSTNSSIYATSDIYTNGNIVCKGLSVQSISYPTLPNVRAYVNGNLYTDNNNRPISFDTLDTTFNNIGFTAGVLNSTGGVFVCPIAGFYRINAKVYIFNTGGATRNINMYVNGVNTRFLTEVISYSGPLFIDTVIFLSVGNSVTFTQLFGGGGIYTLNDSSTSELLIYYLRAN